MHAIQPDLSALDDAVSYYMNGQFGWVLGCGLVALGIGSLALGLALQCRKLAGAAGRVALFIWAIGVVIGGLFPPDPRGSWDKPPSISGMIHANVAMVAFLALPVAAVLLSKQLGNVSASPVIRRFLPALGYAAAVMLVLFFVSLAPVFSDRPPRLLGLSERILLVVYVAWLMVATLAVRCERKPDISPL
jgi:hypothetical protein